ncbi:ATP-binding protein [Nostoc sp.]|uniref:PAS domain-containing protein n=1 Tax=Nostoc sp. TaxID=1180 RepID=UPI003FA5F426
MVANMDGAIAEANDAFLRMVGYSPEDLQAGQVRWRDMIAPKYIEASNSAIAELKTKGVCQPFENEYIRKDDSSSTRSHGGLGLGLAIVHHLVELHGGTVSAESLGIGQGATFIVNLPMKAVGRFPTLVARHRLPLGDDSLYIRKSVSKSCHAAGFTLRALSVVATGEPAHPSWFPSVGDWC